MEQDKHQSQVLQKILDLGPYMSLVTEAQLADYGESAAGGPFAKLRLSDPGELDVFRGKGRASKTKQGTRYYLMLLEIQDDDTIRPADGPTEKPQNDQTPEAEEPKKTSLAFILHKDNWFYSRRVWRALHDSKIYTQEMHKRWVLSLPCIYDPEFWELKLFTVSAMFNRSILLEHSPWLPQIAPGNQIVAHHTRGKENAGMGEKPWDYEIVPIDSLRHTALHNHITTGLMEFTHMIAWGLMAYRVKVVMKDHLKLDSLKWLTQEMFDEFKNRIGLDEHQ